jgi:type IV pilus assembly protein PilV
MNPKLRVSHRGFTMLEVLVTIVVVLIGLLGLAGMQARAQQAEFESYQRAQALMLLQDIVDRINTHRKAASCFAVTTGPGTPYLGASGTGHASLPVTCTTTGGTEAIASIDDWDAMLQGVAETQGGTSVGVMIGARGCIGFDAGVAPNPDTYTVAVAWQGMNDTVAPSLPGGSPPGMSSAVACAQGMYGAGDTKRRVIWTTVQIADLT